MSSPIDPLPLPRKRECPFGPAPEIAGLQRDSPVTKVLCPTGIEAWLVTRYADVREVLSDHERFSARSGQCGHLLANQPPDAPITEGDFARLDGAEHLRFRRVMAPAVTSVKRMERLSPAVRRIVDDALDALATETGTVDLHARFSIPVVTSVMTELFDIPHQDRDLFRTRSEALLNGRGDAESLQAATIPLYMLLQELVTRRTEEPGEDLISVVAASARAAGDPFTSLELTKIAAGLVFSGYDTTSTALTYGMAALLETPGQLAILREDTGAASNAAEEVIRMLAVGGGLLRVAAVDTELAGTPIAAGDYVVAAVQAANRDPARFPHPDRLDVRRPHGGHVGFGHGQHQCSGRHIVRLVLTSALATLARRIPSLRLAVPIAEVEFKKDTAVFGPAELPVTWDEGAVRPR
ncbi:cytochrome P450 [Amycolatopsis minnesotensis]|uniref:Cytochrome P450 n=1 Tax=Amycolatopsis minnesotensis TaxID=337894 RepID=A0ABN2S7Y5_9PSEU